MCLGHVYIVLEPVGSARLTFNDDFVGALRDYLCYMKAHKLIIPIVTEH